MSSLLRLRPKGMTIVYNIDCHSSRTARNLFARGPPTIIVIILSVKHMVKL